MIVNASNKPITKIVIGDEEVLDVNSGWEICSYTYSPIFAQNGDEINSLFITITRSEEE